LYLRKKIFKNRKLTIGLVLILVIGGYFLFRGANDNNEPVIQTTPVEQGMIISSVYASGQVLSVNVMSANTQASGIVKNCLCKRR